MFFLSSHYVSETEQEASYSFRDKTTHKYMKSPANTHVHPNVCRMFCQIHTCWIIASYYFVLAS